VASRERHNAYEGKGCDPRRLFLPEMAVIVAMFATAAYAKAIMGANDRDKLSGTVRGDQILLFGLAGNPSSQRV
jgi:hypothetical protein